MQRLALRAVAIPLIALVAIGALVASSTAMRVGAADHLDAPTVKTDGRLDINDVYVFQGRNESKTVLVMTVNPAAGLLSPTTFRSAARYEFRIDTDGNAIEDITLRTRFSTVRNNGTQVLSLRRADGRDARSQWGGDLIAEGRTGKVIPIEGGGRIWAGLADDPFFFDLARFQTFKATLLAGGGLADLGGLVDCNRTDPEPTDFFKGLNGSAIVIELPDRKLAPVIRVWAETSIHEGQPRVQVERMGLPTINTVFNHTDDTKDAYNRAEPRNDVENYTDDVAGVVSLITGLAGTAEDPDAYGQTVAGLLLPDVITYDTSRKANFAKLNGRALRNDVIDVALTVVANTPLTDCIGNDSNFRAWFPYVGKPN
jgi:hypothetical protein